MLMIRVLWLLLALGLALPVNAADVIYPIGSRIGLAPPPGLAVSHTFVGFEDAANQTAILIAALPAAAYAGLEKSSGADALKRQGITIEKREAFAVGTGRAFLVLGRQEV